MSVPAGCGAAVCRMLSSSRGCVLRETADGTRAAQGENTVDEEGRRAGTLAAIRAAPLTGGRGVFRRVLVGVDRAEASREAARQAAVLCDVEGELTLLAVWGVTPPRLVEVTSE